MENNGSPRPIFDTDDDRTYFLVELPINKYFLNEKVQDEVQDEIVGINELNKTEQSTLKILTGGMFSKNEIAEMLGYKSVTGNLRNASEKLLQL